jgi:anaerobic magnesium-protoporphyrin IX monomethyl ester cyclase
VTQTVHSGLVSHPEIEIRLATRWQFSSTKKYEQDFAALPILSNSAKRLKILLLEPFYPSAATWGSAKVEQGFIPPIGLISVYSFLKYRGYNVEFLDTQFDDYNDNTLKQRLSESSYDVVGIPVFTSTADFAFSTAKLVRDILPNSKIIFGNIHASSQPELTIAQCPEVDFIVKHEGEFTLDELLRSIADNDVSFENIRGIAYKKDGKFHENENRPFISDLNILPPNFYCDIDLSRYIPHPTQYAALPNYPIITQRGCPYSCTYCEASAILGKKIRHFSPERIVEELKILRDKHGARGVYFQDSTFTVNKKYTMSLVDLMQKEKLGLLWSCNTRADKVDDELCSAMHNAGCLQIVLGIESGNQQSLDVVSKQTTVEAQTKGVELIHKHKISTICSYILCLPGETEEMAWNTVNYAKRLGSRIAMFYLPVPYPGSVLYQSCVKDNGIHRASSWSDFLAIDFINPVYVNPLIGKENMARIYRQAFRDYYLTPRVWYSNIRSLMWGMPIGASLRGLNAFTHMFMRHSPGAPFGTLARSMAGSRVSR